jgi:hypothetical protein
MNPYSITAWLALPFLIVMLLMPPIWRVSPKERNFVLFFAIPLLLVIIKLLANHMATIYWPPCGLTCGAGSTERSSLHRLYFQRQCVLHRRRPRSGVPGGIETYLNVCRRVDGKHLIQSYCERISACICGRERDGLRKSMFVAAVRRSKPEIPRITMPVAPDVLFRMPAFLFPRTSLPDLAEAARKPELSYILVKVAPIDEQAKGVQNETIQ